MMISMATSKDTKGKSMHGETKLTEMWKVIQTEMNKHSMMSSVKSMQVRGGREKILMDSLHQTFTKSDRITRSSRLSSVKSSLTMYHSRMTTQLENHLATYYLSKMITGFHS